MVLNLLAKCHYQPQKGGIICLALIVLYLSLLLVSPAFAQEALTFNLGEIVVSKDNETLSANPSSTEVTSQDIEIRNAQTVDEALDFISGVRLTIGQKNEPYVMIRGMNQDKALILLDGIPIASPYYGYVDLNQIPVESIAKIKVIKTPISSLYGANAMGGVINIVSKKAGQKPHLELNNGLSSHRTSYHTLNYSATSKDISLWLSGSYRQSDGFRLSRRFKEKQNENGGFRENSYYEKNAFSLKLGLENNEKHNLSTLFNYIDNEKGIPAHVDSSNPRYWRFTRWRRWMVALADEYKMTDNLSIKGRIFYDKYDNTLKSYDDASYTTQTNTSFKTSIYDEYAIGSSIYLNYNPNDMHFFKSAFNFKKDVHKEQDDEDQPWESYEIRTYSLGMEDNIKVTDKLSLLIGTSFDLFDQIKAYTGQKGSHIHSLNPLFHINYSLTPETSVYSCVSKRTRFPTMHQLYDRDSGNPNLKEQRNTNFEVGIKHDFIETGTIELTYFYNNVKDLIDRASRNDPFLNTSKAVFEGVEANIHTKIGEALSGRLSYTFLKARDKNPDLFSRAEEEIAYVPEYKADLELRYTTKFGLSYDLLGSYNGQRYYYDGSAQHALGGYFVWNTRISQRFLKNWEASIYLENIFDKNYQEEEGYPQPGRSLLFSLKTTF